MTDKAVEEFYRNHKDYEPQYAEINRLSVLVVLPPDLKQGFDLNQRSLKDLHAMLAKGRAMGIETRGIADHGMIHSIYFRDPNGYVIELTAKRPGHDAAMNPRANGARDKLDRWQASKARA